MCQTLFLVYFFCIFSLKYLRISEKSSTFAPINLPRFPSDQRAQGKSFFSSTRSTLTASFYIFPCKIYLFVTFSSFYLSNLKFFIIFAPDMGA